MSDVPSPPAGRPGWARVAFVVLLACVFAVKAGRWWAAVAAGTTTVESMTTWGWVKIAAYHLAVVAGVLGIAEMVRANRRAGPPPDPVPTPQRGGPD